jgi:hypothetical protein
MASHSINFFFQILFKSFFSFRLSVITFTRRLRQVKQPVRVLVLPVRPPRTADVFGGVFDGFVGGVIGLD